MPDGTLYVTGPATFSREAAFVLYQVYSGTLFWLHPAHDGKVTYGINVPLPIGPVYTEISVLSEYGFSGNWYPWNEQEPYAYRPEQAQWAF